MEGQCEESSGDSSPQIRPKRAAQLSQRTEGLLTGDMSYRINIIIALE